MALAIATAQTLTAALAPKQYPESMHDVGPRSIYSHLARHASLLKIPVDARCTFSTTTPFPQRSHLWKTGKASPE
jgi:hypothetical protein